jgi:hypothetical protein
MSEIKAGATDQSIYLALETTAGAPATGLTIANLDATYTRTRAAAVKNDLTALGAANSAHADNQAIEVDATNAPGLYRFDIPDAAFASGAAGVVVTINGAAIKPAHKDIQLVGNTAEDVYTRLGAPAGASVSADLAAVKAETALIVADTNELQTDWANGGRLDLILDARASQASVDTIDGIVDAILADTGTDIPATLATLATAANLAAVAGYLDTEVAAILVIAQKLDTALELDGAVYRFTVNALEQAPTGGSAPTAAQIADEVQTRTIAAVTTVNGLAANTITAAALAADAVAELQAGLATAAALAAVDTVVDAIQARTDALPADPADQSLIIAATDAVMARLGAPAGASVSADIAGVKADSAAILADTGTDGVVVVDKDGYRLGAAGVNDILRTALTEGYAADGAPFTLEQGLFMLWALLAEREVAGTTLTANRLDGSTPAMTFTLDDADAPTSQTRAA